MRWDGKRKGEIVTRYEKIALTSGIVVVLLCSAIYLIMVFHPNPLDKQGLTRINTCIEGIYTPLPAATQTVIASYTPSPVCATQAAQLTAEASIPDWWPWGH